MWGPWGKESSEGRSSKGPLLLASNVIRFKGKLFSISGVKFRWDLKIVVVKREHFFRFCNCPHLPRKSSTVLNETVRPSIHHIALSVFILQNSPKYVSRLSEIQMKLVDYSSIAKLPLGISLGINQNSKLSSRRQTNRCKLQKRNSHDIVLRQHSSSLFLQTL